LRRTVAILLAGLFSFSLIAPLFSAGSDANLPACCRRNGKHHCAMAAGAAQMPSPGRSFQSGGTCPYYPGWFVTGVNSVAFLVSSAPALTPFIGRATVPYASRAVFAGARSRSHGKRGPPPSPSFG